MNYAHELDRFAQILNKVSPIYAGIVQKQQTRMDDKWAKEFVDDLYLLFGKPEKGAWDQAALGYVEFCLDASKSQFYFEKHGKYKNAKFSDVKASNYDNESFMLQNYLPGMVVSHYLWPHHYLMGRIYRDKLMPMVQRRLAPKTFLEAGTGSAMYTIHTLRSLPSVQGFGYDISPHAVRFGTDLIERSGLSDRCELNERDVLTSPPDSSVDFVLSQEVLEHLEDPSSFVANLHRVLKPGGMGFITAAVTAAHSDHIYLFDTPESVFDMFEASGFRVIEKVVEYADHAKAKNITPKIAGALVSKADREA